MYLPLCKNNHQTIIKKNKTRCRLQRFDERELWENFERAEWERAEIRAKGLLTTYWEIPERLLRDKWETADWVKNSEISKTETRTHRVTPWAPGRSQNLYVRESNGWSSAKKQNAKKDAKKIQFLFFSQR